MLRFRPFAIVAATLAVVKAHGYMSKPRPVFQDIDNLDAPSSFVSMTAGRYKGNDVLKDLAERNGGARCGKTDGNAPVRPIPTDGMVKFDITFHHTGPCEIWLDNERVVFEKDCWTKFPNYQIPVDFSNCNKSKCQLRWIWLATDERPGQVYDNCVNVGGGGGDNNNKPVTPSMSPAPAPAPEGDDSYPEDDDSYPEDDEDDDSYPEDDDTYPEDDDAYPEDDDTYPEDDE